EQLTRDVGAVVAREVEHAVGDLLRAAEAAERDRLARAGEELVVVGAEKRRLLAVPALEAGVRDRAGSEAVDADPVARDLEHEALREAVDEELRRRVGARVRDAELAG